MTYKADHSMPFVALKTNDYQTESLNGNITWEN